MCVCVCLCVLNEQYIGKNGQARKLETVQHRQTQSTKAIMAAFVRYIIDTRHVRNVVNKPWPVWKFEVTLSITAAYSQGSGRNRSETQKAVTDFV